MPNATLTRNLPNQTQHLLKKMPQDMKKISEQIISDQQVLKQLVPKILHTILNIKLQQMFQKPKQTNITDQNTQSNNNQTNRIKNYSPPHCLFKQPSTTLFA